MRRLLQNVAAAFVCALGVPAIWRWLNRRRLLVLVYHGVADRPLPDDVPDWHLLPLERFREQIAWLRKHYDILDIDAALERLHRNEIRRPTACITFDDGYLNNRTTALPVLAEERTPATIYLVTGMIGTDRRLWTIELETALRRTRRQRIDLDAIGLGSRALDGLSHRVVVARDIARSIKNRPAAERARVLSAIYAQLETSGEDGTDHFRMMTWDDVAVMEATGLMSFGAHTVSHEIVSRLDDHALSHELGTSVRAVAAHVRNPSRTFAYPNGAPGDFDRRAPRELRKLGVSWGLTTIDGLNGADTDSFEIRRVTVENDTSFARFRLASTGFLAWLRRARRDPRPRLETQPVLTV